MFDAATWIMLGEGLLDTIYMTLASTAMAYLLGLPLGLLLWVHSRGWEWITLGMNGLMENKDMI